MAHGGDAARPSAVEPVPELGVAGAPQGLGAAPFGAGTFHSQLGAAAVRRGVHLDATYGSSGEFAGRGEVRVGDGVLLGAVAHVNLGVGEFPRQSRPGAGRADPGQAHGNPGMFGHKLVGLLPSGLVQQPPHPGAGRGDDLVGLLYGDAGRGTFARQLRPVAGRDAELHVLLPDGLGAAYDNNSGDLARQPGPAASLGTLAEHLRRFLLLVVAMVACSAAVTGLATGGASPAAGFGFFVLLLGGLSLVMIHMLRA